MEKRTISRDELHRIPHAGLEVTEEQKAAINKGMTENYKPIADYDKQVKKTEKAEEERDGYKEQLDTANKTLDKFKDIDPDNISNEIQKYKDEAQAARKEADKKILQCDHKDYLRAEFDKLGIASERTRNSLMTDIMGEDGFRCKDGAFIGIA